jgi:hypothetical protein
MYIIPKFKFNDKQGFTPEYIRGLIDYLMIDKELFLEEIKNKYSERIPITKMNQQKLKAFTLKSVKPKIILYGKNLLYWIMNSEIINIYADIKGINANNALDSILEVDVADFLGETPEGEIYWNFPSGESDWRLLTDLLEGKIIAERDNDEITFKQDFTMGQVNTLLDFLLFMTPTTMWYGIQRFILNKKPYIKPNGRNLNFGNNGIDINIESVNSNYLNSNSNNARELGYQNARRELAEGTNSPVVRRPLPTLNFKKLLGGTRRAKKLKRKTRKC